MGNGGKKSRRSVLRTQRNSSLTLGVEKRFAQAPRGERSGLKFWTVFGFSINL